MQYWLDRCEHWVGHKSVTSSLWQVHRVKSSLYQWQRLWRVHCDDFTVWRVLRVTISPCDEFTDSRLGYAMSSWSFSAKYLKELIWLLTWWYKRYYWYSSEYVYLDWSQLDFQVWPWSWRMSVSVLCLCLFQLLNILVRGVYFVFMNDNIIVECSIHVTIAINYFVNISLYFSKSLVVLRFGGRLRDTFYKEVGPL